MDAKDAIHAPIAAPPRPISVEITPIEYEYYMKRAQEMRSAAMAGALGARFAALVRLFARAKPAPHRREPVLVKFVRSRTA